MIEEADAAIVIRNDDCTLGCTGCARTNELTRFLLKTKRIPLLELDYPEDEFQAKRFVHKIREFLEELN